MCPSSGNPSMRKEEAEVEEEEEEEEEEERTIRDTLQQQHTARVRDSTIFDKVLENLAEIISFPTKLDKNKYFKPFY